MIWIIEDDEDIRELVLYALRTANFDARGFESGVDFFRELSCEEFPPLDLIILDIMLPGDDGLSILTKLRKDLHYQSIPIIMLTAKSGEYDKVKGLDLGADDYLTKPFGVMELISRIKALLRRSSFAPSKQDKNIYKNIEMNHSTRVVIVDDMPINLTYKEYELLHYLLINQRVVLKRERILESIWGYDFEGESRTLDMHIRALRQKLGAAGKLIQTVRNVGYKLGE